MNVVFETERLCVRLAMPDDALLVHALWTSPDVMANVGYPNGLGVTEAEIRERITQDAGVLGSLLIAETTDGTPIGQCLVGPPDERGIASTDIKLLPSRWGQGFGTEVKRGLLDHLFTHTDCVAVEATPNVGNVASIRMQEAVGGVRVGEGVFEAPGATPVHHDVYRVTRETWEQSQG